LQLSVSFLFQFWYAQNCVGVSLELRESQRNSSGNL
jgi:hypothetical protein